MEKLSREFYQRDTLLVAKELLGKYLVHNVDNNDLIGKIVEVEAYKGPQDKAAHSYGGRRTERNEIMYGQGGYVYVFVIYGMYNCFNVVSETEGIPRAVLIRALEPIQGKEIMALNRYKKSIEDLSKRDIKNLTNGPGKLCMALNITRKDNGSDLLGDNIYILNADPVKDEEIITTKRINIDYAEEAVHYPWRFYIKGNDYISVRDKLAEKQ